MSLLLLAWTTARVASADPLEQCAPLEEAVARAEGARAEVEGRRASLDAENAHAAQAIERLKAASSGVARDHQLGELRAVIETRAGELDRLERTLRQRTEAVNRARSRLLSAYDQVLDSLPSSDASRGEIARRRVQEAAKLPADRVPHIVARPSVDPLDGPTELEEKADRLKDSEEQLRRELGRLERRITGIEARRRLRERAGALEEDLFVEAGSGRRLLRSAEVQRSVAPASPSGRSAEAPGDPSTGGRESVPVRGTEQDSTFGAAGPTGSAPPPNAPVATGISTPPSAIATGGGVALRGVIDPATFDELRRAEGSSDPDIQLRALRSAEDNLRRLVGQLGRDEADLRQRARALRKK